MPSTVSTTAMIQWLRTDAVDLDGLSALIGAIFADALATVARRRADGSLPGVHGDVRFADLMADPVAAIAAAYGEIGGAHPGPPAGDRRLPGGQAAGEHGTHAYTAADWASTRTRSGPASPVHVRLRGRGRGRRLNVGVRAAGRREAPPPRSAPRSGPRAA